MLNGKRDAQSHYIFQEFLCEQKTKLDKLKEDFISDTIKTFGQKFKQTDKDREFISDCVRTNMMFHLANKAELELLCDYYNSEEVDDSEINYEGNADLETNIKAYLKLVK